ncbi:MAG: GNAT family N-acetyltransferase [Promicromonosporaceae bacterium]|nr:GNAT family N-acetyltransferase [Promicromonosporaceae bacterium]
MAEYTPVIEWVETAAQFDEAYAVRVQVFVIEQQVPPELELDEQDSSPTTTHVLARDPATGAAIAAARLLSAPATPGIVHIGRVAVLAEYRGRGVGASLMTALEQIAQANHATPEGTVTVELSAQTQAIGFYERCGYEVHGPTYLDAGIDHRDARKTLTPVAADG